MIAACPGERPRVQPSHLGGVPLLSVAQSQAPADGRGWSAILVLSLAGARDDKPGLDSARDKFLLISSPPLCTGASRSLLPQHHTSCLFTWQHLLAECIWWAYSFAYFLSFSLTVSSLKVGDSCPRPFKPGAVLGASRAPEIDMRKAMNDACKTDSVSHMPH